VGGGFVNHTRKAKKTFLGLSKVLKGRIKKDNLKLVEAEKQLIKIAEEVIARGQEVKAEVEALKETLPGVKELGEQLGGWLKRTEQIVQQTKAVIAGQRHLKKRLVSIFDLNARPIRRGKIRVETEFGQKVLIGETDHGIITTYKVLEENPADVTLLKTGVKGHRRLFRKRLKAVATDRGFYSQANEKWLKEDKVKQISIPVRGKASRERLMEQKQPWFRRLQRFRAGSEGRISLLKRVFGLGRSLMRGNQGAEIWVGQGIFTHNLWQAARIM
jgi:hypothetical protein